MLGYALLSSITIFCFCIGGILLLHEGREILDQAKEADHPRKNFLRLKAVISLIAGVAIIAVCILSMVLLIDFFFFVDELWTKLLVW